MCASVGKTNRTDSFVAAVVTRGRRAFDLLIAATALSRELSLYTCNPGDFAALDGLLDAVAVETP